MDVSTIASTITNATGNIAKACIVLDNDWPDNDSITMLDSVKAGGTSTLSSLVSTVASKVLSIGTSLVKGATCNYYVMFNPNTLTLSGHGGGKEIQRNYDSKGIMRVKINPGTVRIMLNVTLIFDTTYPASSFLYDKMKMSMSSAVSAVASSAASLLDLTEYSVKADVEAFLSTMQRVETREMKFCWGNLVYEGYLDNISAKYTMFDPEGNATRAEVALSMVCYTNVGMIPNNPQKNTVLATKFINNQQRWDEQFDLAFSSDWKSKLSGAASTVSNLLNISL